MVNYSARCEIYPILYVTGLESEIELGLETRNESHAKFRPLAVVQWIRAIWGQLFGRVLLLRANGFICLLLQQSGFF